LILVLTGVLLILGLIEAVTSLIVLRNLQGQTIQTLGMANQIQSLGQNIQSRFSAARQNEFQVVIQSKTQGYSLQSSVYASANETDLALARQSINDIERLALTSQDPNLRSLTEEVQQLRPLLDQYQGAFQGTVSTIRQSKLPGGLEDQLSSHINALKQALIHLPNQSYVQLVYQIENAISSYLLQPDPAAIEQVRLPVSQLTSQIQAAKPEEFASSEKTPQDLIQSCVDLLNVFDRRVAAVNAETTDLATIQEAAQKINQELDRINTKSDFGVSMAQNSMNRINRQANLTIPIVAGLALALGILAFFLISHQILPPLARLSKAAQEMEMGGFDQQVEVGGGAELAALAQAFNSMSRQLRQVLSGLEGRVKQQTQQLEERSQQLQFAAEVARDIASTRGDLEDLLNRSVNLIRDRFGFYHAGVFLIDEQGEYAILRAATGEAGAAMLKRGHRLKVGAEGIVGYASRIGKPRISLDVGADAVHFKNPLLPDTRSEMALPLKIGQTVIGALDVQSTVASAFREEDISVLQLMADQLAIAIDNTRLFKAAQDNLQQMQLAYGQYSREAWERLGQSRNVYGYSYDAKGLHPLESASTGDSNLSSGRPAPSGSFAFKVHGQAIGVLEVWSEDQAGLSEIEKNTLEVIADRISQVMDSARLYEETRVRAAREETLNQLTAQFTQSLRFDVLLQSAVQELGRLPKVAEASIHIGLPENDGQAMERI
jgi:nitrate/nitrite-specific signal transduction histidine kinase